MVYPHTFATQPAGNVPASFLDDNFNAALQASLNLSDVANAATARGNLGIIGSAGLPSVRQTVNGGPVSTNVLTPGVPTFLPATSVNLNLTTQNVSSATPLTCTAANNVLNTSGANNDAFGFSVANFTWNGLTNATTNYLYVIITPSTGLMTPGFTVLPPIYQAGGVPAVTAGQFTFNIGEMRGYLGNGAAAPQAYVVFLGEAVTAGAAVTSTIAYAYNAFFESAFTVTLPGAAVFTPVSHNLGVTPRIAEITIENIIAEIGYAIGDQVSSGAILTNAGGSLTIPTVTSNRLTGGFQTGSNTGLGLLSRTAGGATILTAADWKYRFYFARGW